MTDPVRAVALLPDAEAVDLPEPVPHASRRAREPRERVLRILRDAGWDAAALDAVPRGWEKLGDVLVIDVPDALRDRERALARAFAEALRLKTVLARAGTIGGEFREPRARFLLGDDPVAVHVENGVRYKLDASRLMFSAGNVHERTRMGRVDARGETVVDCFAGVGYFTLPLAVHAGAARVVAIEKNPVSHAYLAENARLNGVADVVQPWLGDNRDYPERGFADRVMLGYVDVTHAFLDHAMALLKPEGGTIHYHDTAYAHEWRDLFTRRIVDAATRANRSARVVDARVVKTYGPGKVHAVVDARVGPATADAAPENRRT